MGAAGFYLSRSKWNWTDFGQNRLTVRSGFIHIYEGSAGEIEDKISFRCSASPHNSKIFYLLRGAVCHGSPETKSQVNQEQCNPIEKERKPVPAISNPKQGDRQSGLPHFFVVSRLAASLLLERGWA
jgi:hypothetical protein